MSDSSTINFQNPARIHPQIKNLDFIGCHSSWKKLTIISEQDEISSVNSLSSYVCGLTTAKNHITATLDLNGTDPFEVHGYVLESNSPASTVANNALPENLVYLVSLYNKLMVQKHLLSKNVHVEVVKKISLKDASCWCRCNLDQLRKVCTNRLSMCSSS